MYEAVTEWLENDHPSVTYTDNDLWELLREDAKPSIDQPEALTLYWQSQQLGVPVYDAPVRQWPWILLKEILVTTNAIAHHEKRCADNAAKRMEFIQKQNQFNQG